MRLIGLMPVRNEAWCLGLSARVALMWCDALVIFNHASTDDTAKIVWELGAEYGNRIYSMGSSMIEWHEMAQRQSMLQSARHMDATHLAIIDADEVLTGNLLGLGDGSETAHHVRSFVPHISSGSILQLPLYNLRDSLNRYHANGIWGQRWGSLAFSDRSDLHWAGDKFHQREPWGEGAHRLKPYQPVSQGQGGILHLWGASDRRLVARHAMYKVTERLRWPTKSAEAIELEYNLWRSPADSKAMFPQQTEWAKPWTFSDVPASWWEPYAHLMKYLDVDAEPWQIEAVCTAIKTHGRERFSGLDLFVVDSEQF